MLMELLGNHTPLRELFLEDFLREHFFDGGGGGGDGGRALVSLF